LVKVHLKASGSGVGAGGRVVSYASTYAVDTGLQVAVGAKAGISTGDIVRAAQTYGDVTLYVEAEYLASAAAEAGCSMGVGEPIECSASARAEVEAAIRAGATGETTLAGIPVVGEVMYEAKVYATAAAEARIGPDGISASADAQHGAEVSVGYKVTGELAAGVVVSQWGQGNAGVEAHAGVRGEAGINGVGGSANAGLSVYAGVSAGTSAELGNYHTLAAEGHAGVSASMEAEATAEFTMTNLETGYEASVEAGVTASGEVSSSNRHGSASLGAEACAMCAGG